MTQNIYKKHILGSGVRLILIPMSGVESVAVSVMVGVGSRYEESHNNGISHFLEHMVFKGTKKYPTTDDVNFIERIGGIQNAYTDIDITNYHNKVLASDWKLGLEINKELALYPLLEQSHVDRERSVIVEEMKRYEDNPAAKSEETLHMMMYPNTKLGLRTIGYEKSLKNVASGELRKYHQKWYQAGRTVVVVAGNIEGSQKEILNQVNEWFGMLDKAKHDGIETISDIQDSPRIKIVTKKDAAQAHFVLGLRTFRRESSDRFAWGVFNLLMGVGFTSRLFREIREKRGLCYHIRSNSHNFQDVGFWQIYAGVATDRVHEAVGETVKQLKQVLEEGINEKEVEVAKKRLGTIMAFKLENPEFVNEFYGRQEVFDMKVLTPDEYLKKVSQVTVDDISKAVKKYIKKNTLNLALVWKKGEDPELLKLLSFQG